ncbi:MAG TPA: chorismate-binding protein, partial [Burkholderiales bacterium]|nr:chorismate-binding protein [Burkholderiales bacterium]
MASDFLTELPYQPDSARLFEIVADWPWAVFLDSGLHCPGQSRYDIIAAQPYVRLITRGNLTEIHADRVVLARDDPFALLQHHLAIDSTIPAGDLPFCGGAIGYFGYDLARRIESLPVCAQDAEKIPDMVVGIYDWAVVVDHLERRTWLVGQGRDPETDLKWNRLVRCFSEPAAERQRAPFRVRSPIVSNMTREYYVQAFRRVHDYIRNGDCYQVNLAQRFSARADGDAWLACQALRILNPAPFAAYLSTPYAAILSASPERFLRVHGRHVETKPIKGTRPRAGHPRLD